MNNLLEKLMENEYLKSFGQKPQKEFQPIQGQPMYSDTPGRYISNWREDKKGIVEGRMNPSAGYQEEQAILRELYNRKHPIPAQLREKFLLEKFLSDMRQGYPNMNNQGLGERNPNFWKM